MCADRSPLDRSSCSSWSCGSGRARTGPAAWTDAPLWNHLASRSSNDMPEGQKGCSTRQPHRWCRSTVARPGAHLHQDSGAEVLVSVPPVTGAAGAAAGTQDTLVQAVLRQARLLVTRDRNNRILLRWRGRMYQFLSVLHGLLVLLLPFIGFILLLQVGLNRLVLGVKVTHVLQTQTISFRTTLVPML